MRALVYLLRMTLWNSLLQLLKKPIMMILGVIFFAMMLLVMLPGGRVNASGSIDLDMLRAAVFALFGFVAYTTISKGLKQGSTFFSMPDVNMLFTSPIRPQMVLLYGVVRQMGVSLMATLFLCFQIPNMRNFLHLSGLGIFAVISGWFLMLLVAQILSLCTYSLTAPYPFRRRVGNIILYGWIGLIAIGMVGYLLARGGNMNALIDFFGLPVVDFYPVIGWINAYIFGLMDGEIVKAILFLLLLVFFPVLCIVLVRRTNSDYYEDVLQTTEQRFSMRQALREGKISAKNVHLHARTGKSGLIGRGTGASTFFFRHLTEQRRTGMLFLDVSSFVIIITGVIGGIIFRNLSQKGAIMPLEIEIIMLSILCYILYVMTMSGKFTQELSKPFLYMVPASAVMKLFFANLSTVVKSFFEGLAAFALVTILAGLPLWYMILAAVLYATMSQLFISISILTQRMMGGSGSKILGAFLYFLCTAILLLPGIAIFGILHAVFYFAGQEYLFAAYLATILYNIAVSALILFVGRGILREVNT